MTDVPPSGERLASLRKDGSPSIRPFRRILVANRGEIAVRIIRACRELGIETVAVHSSADVAAAHVRLADEAVAIGPAPAAQSYLRGDRIVAAAVATGAEAIHPGYGFLSERAEFARAVEDAGLVFVGPSSRTIATLGDKLAARRTVAEAGVPVVPGTLEPARVDTPEALDAVRTAAGAVGFPLLVKAAAGGGGRGMRRVVDPGELPAALTAAAAEALAAFGDSSVYLEREIRPARHVEVQLVGDREGTVVAIGERDCSLQRRHQKLVEEAPAPDLTADERRRLHGMAEAAGRSASLENAATAEFLFDRDRRFWFLEVNTRLQVEHGVTELAADVDLVREQLWIAAGRPLSSEIRRAAAAAASPARHAIEVRLSAEDPGRDFAPASGRIDRWVMPAGPGTRVDTAIRPGDRVPPDYDPLIAKILVVDGDRRAALARLRRALEETDVSGIQTSLPFHRFIAGYGPFLEGPLPIDWVDEHWAEEAAALRASALDVATREVAAWFASGGAAEPGRPVAAGADGIGAARGGPSRTAPGAGPTAWARAGRPDGRDRPG